MSLLRFKSSGLGLRSWSRVGLRSKSRSSALRSLTHESYFSSRAKSEANSQPDVTRDSGRRPTTDTVYFVRHTQSGDPNNSDSNSHAQCGADVNEVRGRDTGTESDGNENEGEKLYQPPWYLFFTKQYWLEVRAFLHGMPNPPEVRQLNFRNLSLKQHIAVWKDAFEVYTDSWRGLVLGMGALTSVVVLCAWFSAVQKSVACDPRQSLPLRRCAWTYSRSLT